MADREATAQTGINGSGVQSDAALADAPATEPQPQTEQTNVSDNAGQQSTSAATPPVVAAPPAATAPDPVPKKQRWWWNRLGGLRPSPLATLAVLAVLTALSIIGGLVFGESALGKTCVVGLIPAFSIAIGIVVTHWYSKRNLNEQLASLVQNAMYTTLHLKRSVRYVDDRLGSAQEYLEGSGPLGALLEVVRAKTATELSFGTAQQSSRQWESISESGARAAHLLFVEDDDELRPRIRQGDNPKTVATSGETAVSGDGENE